MKMINSDQEIQIRQMLRRLTDVVLNNPPEAIEEWLAKAEKKGRENEESH